MSTELDTKDSTAPESQASKPVASIPATAPSGLLRRRRNQVAAALLVIAVVAGFVANNLLARQYTAEGAVRQYLSAVQSGDAAGAWSAIQVSAPSQSAAASLTDRAALQAALATAKPSFTSFDITATKSIDASTSVVSVSYKRSSGIRQSLELVQRSGERRFGLYPVWRLAVIPVLLQVNLPKGSNGVTIDGKAVALPAGKSTVAVLPLVHKVVFNGTPMLVAETITVDAMFPPSPTLAFRAKLTAEGVSKTRAAIKAAFDACTRQTDLLPRGCPQHVDEFFAGSGQWSLVGDPTQDLSLGFDQDLNAEATGHFQMVAAYQKISVPGTQHWPSSGGYSAELTLAADGVSVGPIRADDGLPALQRPQAVTDQAAKDLVSKAIMACKATRYPQIADCPQSIVDAGATNVHWTLRGDPLANATVSFDQQTGLFTVHGDIDMSATFDWLGTRRSGSSFYPKYNAYLLWDGQSLQLVTVAGALS